MNRPTITQKDIAESVHYRVVLTVIEVTGLPERKTREIVSVTTSDKDKLSALYRAADYVQLEINHNTPLSSLPPVPLSPKSTDDAND